MAHRIDIHHHVLPPFYKEEARERILASAKGFPQLFDWTPEVSLREMDSTGMEAAVLSISTPGIWFGDPAQAKSLARRCNEYGAQLVRDQPRRFGLFATLPLPDRDASLTEIAHAFDVLKADGIGLLTNYGTTWLGDASQAEVFDELNRRKAVVFVHPHVADCCTSTLTSVASGLIELLFDTTRAITNLLYTGTFARCPDIRFIFCHGGGGLAQMADRIASPGRNPAMAAKVPNGVMHELGKLYLDVASMTGARSFNAIRDLVGISHMLFGTDFPFGPVAPIVAALHKLGLPPGELRALERDNALGLLPRLR